MKRISVAFAVLALSVFATADSLRSQIDAMNKTMHKVMIKRDANAFIQVVKPGVTKDFKYIENGKPQNFDEMAAGIKAGFATMTKVTVADSKVLSLVEKGNTATSTTTHKLVGISVDEKKKSHTMAFSGTSVETYRKEKGKWLMSSMTWTNQKMTMDGKAMPGG